MSDEGSRPCHRTAGAPCEMIVSITSFEEPGSLAALLTKTKNASNLNLDLYRLWILSVYDYRKDKYLCNNNNCLRSAVGWY